MIFRFGHWLGHQIALLMCWYDAQPGWLQLALVVVMILALVALCHLDDQRLKRRMWRMSETWLRAQGRELPEGDDDGRET